MKQPLVRSRCSLCPESRDLTLLPLPALIKTQSNWPPDIEMGKYLTSLSIVKVDQIEWSLSSQPRSENDDFVSVAWQYLQEWMLYWLMWCRQVRPSVPQDEGTHPPGEVCEVAVLPLLLLVLVREGEEPPDHVLIFLGPAVAGLLEMFGYFWLLSVQYLPVGFPPSGKLSWCLCVCTELLWFYRSRVETEIWTGHFLFDTPVQSNVQFCSKQIQYWKRETTSMLPLKSHFYWEQFNLTNFINSFTNWKKNTNIYHLSFI